MLLASILAILLAIAALVGLADALYFVGVTYGLLRPDASWIPRVCQMSEDTCATITETRYARVFGLPNAVFGAVWYLIVLGLAGVVLSRGSLPYCTLFLLAAAGVVLFSVYLIWALVQRLDVFCPLCYLGHGLNFSIMVLLGAACILL